MSRLIGDSCAAERPHRDVRAGATLQGRMERSVPSRGRSRLRIPAPPGGCAKPHGSNDAIISTQGRHNRGALALKPDRTSDRALKGAPTELSAPCWSDASRDLLIWNPEKIAAHAAAATGFRARYLPRFGSWIVGSGGKPHQRATIARNSRSRLEGRSYQRPGGVASRPWAAPISSSGAAAVCRRKFAWRSIAAMGRSHFFRVTLPPFGGSDFDRGIQLL